MTHRGDSDWHGWSLQEVTERVAQQIYTQMRQAWPTAVQLRTSEDVMQSDFKRQCLEIALPNVTAVLDVLNGMDHPVLDELSAVFTRLDLALEHRHGAIAQVDALAEIRTIVNRYTQEEA